MPQQTFQRCFNVVFWLIRRRDVGKLQINVETMYFNVDINNVRQRRNHVVILNVDMNNAGKRQNNAVKMSIFKKKKQIISNRIHKIRTFNYYFRIFFTLLPIVSWICRRVLARPRKFFKYNERFCIAIT